MNWQKICEEIKVGDRVRCVNSTPISKMQADFTTPGGAGWVEGREFTVSSISPCSGDLSTLKVYWQNEQKDGVYSNYVIKV